MSVLIWTGAIQMWEAPNFETAILSYINTEIVNHAKFHLPRRNIRQSCLMNMFWAFFFLITVCNRPHSRDFSLCLGNNSSLFIPEFTAATLAVRLKSTALSYNRTLLYWEIENLSNNKSYSVFQVNIKFSIFSWN